MSVLELATSAATVRIAPALGAALTSFVVDGAPVLRPTPDAALAEGNVLATSCYPLVPYSNRIRGAQLHFAGRTYALAQNFGTHPHAIHGLGWQRAWRVEEASATHARLALDHDARGDDARAWPWPFVATQTFALHDARHAVVLVATLTIANVGDEAFPFGLGFHPFFPKDATTTLGFAADGVWFNDPTQLPQAHAPLAPGWRFDPPRTLDALALDNVFTGWQGRATLADATRTVVVDADRALRFLVVYAPAGRDFVAVEPVTHETDAFNRGAHGAHGTGMRILPPGAAFSCTMRVAATTRADAASPRPAR